MKKSSGMTTEELKELIDAHLKEKIDFESSVKELNYKLDARKNTLLQMDEAIHQRQGDLKAVDDDVKAKYADRLEKIDGREEAAKLRESKVEHAEMDSRQKVNDLEQRETAVSLKERDVETREKEANNRFGRMEDFLVRAKDLLEELK